MYMLTTDVLLKKIGIKSAKTLTRWHQAGIIPRPVVAFHPSGRGRISYWPTSTVDICRKLLNSRKRPSMVEASTAIESLASRVRELERRVADLEGQRPLFRP